ncbi:MAG: tetratricopeptide repeat protein [Anaerolineales bacterium]|nr:tetratricopeptide repeat protein [Anaerolineales bacterium]
MPTLQISLLGPLQVRLSGVPAHLRTDAMRVLLAYLARHEGVPQRRDRLADLLSPDRPNPAALTYLRNRLTLLRKALKDDEAVPPWFMVDRKQIMLRTGDDVLVDLSRFEQLLARVEAHAHRQLAGCPHCLTLLQEAVALVRGEMMAGLNFPSEPWELWLLTQREYVNQRALEAMTWLREALLTRGDWEGALAIAQRQLQIEPWLEAAHRAAMQARFQLGDRNGALAQFEQCKARLWDELGVEPDPESEQLRQALFDQQPLRSDTDKKEPWPTPIGPFFGREREQAHLLQTLVDPAHRLVTIVGAGGIGKTRLALEVGRQLRMSFPDGVYFVPLDAVKGGAEQIKIAIGEAAGLAQADQQLTGEQVLSILRDKAMLLILDNCEMVLDELAFLPDWLKRAPQLALLTTSREALAFHAESLLILTGLPTGEAALNAAEAMFEARGQAARADFALSEATLPQVRQICRLVDGSPLAIALAAAWVRRRSLTQIIDSIGESLDFLSSRMRDVDPRHRSMRAAFETSWQLLDGQEQAVLAALSIFPTPFSATAALAIAGASLADLDTLCDKSLLQQESEAERYQMHSLLRQFTAEKLGARAPDVAQRFVDYFHRFAAANQQSYGPLQAEWRNLLAAITLAHRRAEWATVLSFVRLLDKPWFRQIRFNDMRIGLTMAVAAATALDDRPALAQSLLRLGEVEMEQSDYQAAERCLNDALNHFLHLEDGLGIAQSQYALSRIKLEQAHDEEAVRLSQESMRLFEEAGDGLGVARNLNLLALCCIKQRRDFATAQRHLEEAAALQRALPLTSSYVETLRHLARVQSMAGDTERAAQRLAEAAQVAQKLGNLGEEGAVLYERLLLAKEQAQWEAALAFGGTALERFRALGSLRWEALIKTQLGLLHQQRGDPHAALALVNEGLELFDALGDRYEQSYSLYYASILYDALGQAERGAAAKGRARQLAAALGDPLLIARLAEGDGAL